MKVKQGFASALSKLDIQEVDDHSSSLACSLNELNMGSYSVLQDDVRREVDCVFGPSADGQLPPAVHLDRFLPKLYVPCSHVLDIAQVEPLWQKLSSGIIPANESCQAAERV